MDARRRRAFIAIALALLALLLGLRFALQPERATRVLLSRVAGTLGLDITFNASADHWLRGTPRLEFPGRVARGPVALLPVTHLRSVVRRVGHAWASAGRARLE